MKIRKLEAHEVEFEITIEEESNSVRGNYMNSGDAEQDREGEEEIYERLRNGDEKAWCELTVKATWKDFKGDTVSMGCCSVAEDQTLAEYIGEVGLANDALSLLNAKLEDTLYVLETLEVEESEPPTVRIPEASSSWDAMVKRTKPSPGYWQET